VLLAVLALGGCGDTDWTPRGPTVDAGACVYRVRLPAPRTPGTGETLLLATDGLQAQDETIVGLVFLLPVSGQVQELRFDSSPIVDGWRVFRHGTSPSRLDEPMRTAVRPLDLGAARVEWPDVTVVFEGPGLLGGAREPTTLTRVAPRGDPSDDGTVFTAASGWVAYGPTVFPVPSQLVRRTPTPEDPREEESRIDVPVIVSALAARDSSEVRLWPATDWRGGDGAFAFRKDGQDGIVGRKLVAWRSSHAALDDGFVWLEWRLPPGDSAPFPWTRGLLAGVSGGKFEDRRR
jgi:hypothetical protein